MKTIKQKWNHASPWIAILTFLIGVFSLGAVIGPTDEFRKLLGMDSLTTEQFYKYKELETKIDELKESAAQVELNYQETASELNAAERVCIPAVLKMRQERLNDVEQIYPVVAGVSGDPALLVRRYFEEIFSDYRTQDVETLSRKYCASS